MVLPFVPVTPRTRRCAEGLRKNCEQIGPTALRTDGTRTCGTPTSSQRSTRHATAPADHPRFAEIVVLNENNPAYQFGGASAAPVWSEIMQFALTQYGVAPTDVANAQYNAARAASQYNCAVPHGSQVAPNGANNANSGAAGTGGHAGTGGNSGSTASEPAKSAGTTNLRSATSPSN